jgi:hypothetical protein
MAREDQTQADLAREAVMRADPAQAVVMQADQAREAVMRADPAQAAGT